MKANYDHRPENIEPVGNGSYLINYNIQERKSDENTSYDCDQVIVWNEPTPDKIKQAIIVSEFPDDIEKKLINDFNASVEQILPHTAKQPYLDFLQRRKEIKSMVDNLFI